MFLHNTTIYIRLCVSTRRAFPSREDVRETAREWCACAGACSASVNGVHVSCMHNRVHIVLVIENNRSCCFVFGRGPREAARPFRAFHRPCTCVHAFDPGPAPVGTSTFTSRSIVEAAARPKRPRRTRHTRHCRSCPYILCFQIFSTTDGRISKRWFKMSTRGLYFH
jgi:hypothetical protein